MIVGDEQKANAARASIKEARESQGISLRGMARALGMNPGSYHRIESGVGGLRVDLVFSIADILNVEPASLLGVYEEDFTRLYAAFRALPESRRLRLLEQAEDYLTLQALQDPPPEDPHK